ncbi:PTPA-CTERM sorting domain-containing protein [Phormidesmis priestleyi]|uniref:PTPA-CTERM sorting domain-containing protein n=1 Tax=Phormidesmis priestleyi TaxID=268141 RepID=UPI0012E7C450|nr:PTPA-CTERM sorting domain-containing protein [Phormidesmis priestleyi]
MKSKTMFFGAAATAIALSAATISASPAQALSITPGSILNIGGVVQANPNNAAPTEFVFDAPFPEFGGGPGKTVIYKKGSTGSFAGLDRFAPIQNLTLTQLTPGGHLFSSGSVTNFITNIKAGISFDLTKFIYDNSKSSATFEGIFRSGTDSIAAKGGLFTSQLTSFNPASYSGSIAAIPTPAMLPGLIGLGMGMLRKRKREMAAANAEA